MDNMTANALFIGTSALALSAVMAWGFANLPKHRWQVLAAVPSKHLGGEWKGINLTYYGALVATANVLSAALFLVLTAGIGVSVAQFATLAAVIFGVSLPAAKLIAVFVEGKKGTFTVSGASFAGFMALPPAILAINASGLFAADLPAMPVMAAVAAAYALGEGFGRLACISFGCCYGKPMSDMPRWARKLWRMRGFTFLGETKKVAYEGGLEGKEVFPVQAVTCVLYVAAALGSTWLFLSGEYGGAFVLSVAVTQGWRVASEFLRADFRGALRFSAYQGLSVFMILASVGLMVLMPAEGALPAPSVTLGLAALWSPAVVLFLQGLWALIFIYMGRSTVTGSRIILNVEGRRV